MGNTVVGIVGTGMIASSMAVLCAGHGMPTFLLARSDESIARCKKSIDGFFEEIVEKEIFTRKKMQECLALITLTKNYEDLKDVEIVFESVVEDVDVKYQVYKQLEENCPRIKAICSVSSSIVPNVLAEGAGKNFDKVIVTHPFNPPHLVPYFELCQSDKTSDGVMDYVFNILVLLDRKPVILKKPTPGFIGNRLQFALWREALALVEEGICDARDVDTCLANSFGPRYTSIGIFEHFDNGGLLLNASSCKNIWPVISNKTDIPKFMQDLMDEGKMGAKSESKQGFYDWRDVDMEEYAKRVSAPYWKMLDWSEKNN